MTKAELESSRLRGIPVFDQLARKIHADRAHPYGWRTTKFRNEEALELSNTDTTATRKNLASKMRVARRRRPVFDTLKTSGHKVNTM